MNKIRHSRRAFAIALVMGLVASGLAVATGASEEAGMRGELSIAVWGQIEADPNHPVYSVHELLQEWDGLHPGLRLTYEYNGGQSVTDRFTWIRTRMLSRTLPDVVMIYFPSDDFYDRELLYDLAPELDKPNPYSASATWRDDFPQDAQIVSDHLQPDGGLYVAGFTQSGNVGVTSFIYNQDIFDEVGVSVPRTWAEFLDTQERIKAAGYTPFHQPTAGPLGWLVDWPLWVLKWQLLEEVAAEADVNRPYDQISQYELVRAYKRGIFTPFDPRYQEAWRLLKEWSQYWQEGFLAPPQGDPFVEGKAAMQHMMTLWLPRIAANPNVTFNWGTFYQPQLTQESTRHATGATPRRVGNSGAGASGSVFFMIPQTTVQRGRLAPSLDLLHFLTAPPQLDYWCDNQTIPCFDPGTSVVDVYSDPAVQRQMAGFFEPSAFENGSLNLSFGHGTQDTGTQVRKLVQEYLGDAITLEAAMEELDAILRVAYDELIASNPDWVTDW